MSWYLFFLCLKSPHRILNLGSPLLFGAFWVWHFCFFWACYT
uniref:Uncharacterized protein n=1 Tax=Rhizophora mucronata TaxID=61149 RepID=A0A2P2NQU8_RHIMU